MNIVDLIQGTPEWLAHRNEHDNASDAPAMMGCSPYKTRSALVAQYATGIGEDVSADQQRRFDAGHRFEALARPLAEEVIGEELSPVVGTRGRLSASFDGITFLGDTIFEHKTLNDSLRYTPWDEGNGDHLPLHFRVQMEQQLYVSGAERVLFMATKWSGDECTERRHCWYVSDADLRAQILAGWEQFHADVAAYVPPAAAAPAATGTAPETLPALRIEVTGAVTASNLTEFKQTALTAIRSVNRDLKTDQDFADAAKAVKWCEDIESRLKAAKEHALSQTADIDALFKTLDDIGAEARSVRLDLDKLVKRRKDEVKEEAVMAARRALAQHIEALNAELAPVRLQTPAVDFALAIKGLRSIASMQDALDTELATGKISADAQARVIRANRSALDSAEASHLFPDFAQVCTKPADDFASLILARQHAAAQRIEAERARIRAEEAARLEREAAARRAEEERQQRAAAEATARAEAAAQAQRDAEARAAADAQAEAETLANRGALIERGREIVNDIIAAEVLGDAIARTAAEPVRAPAPEVRAFRPAAVAPAVAEQPTMTLGQLGTRLGFNPSADFLAGLGFEAHKDRASRLYRPSQFGDICKAIASHLILLAAEEKQAA